MIKYVRTLSPFATADPELLGTKGAELVGLVQIGLPVPPAFVVTTEACGHFREHGSEPDGLERELLRELAVLEEQVGRRFGDPANPLLVSVRSCEVSSLPGAMETVLDLGLNDDTVAGLAATSGDEWFALDCYRRLLQMFGTAVAGVPADRYEPAPGPSAEIEALRSAIEGNKQVFLDHMGVPFPTDPLDQLRMAITAAFGHGTGAVVQAMVFGNRGLYSGTGVAFSRDPETGWPGDFGTYVPLGQGEDVRRSDRVAVPFAELHQLDLASYRRLRSFMNTLERHHRDMCRIEFTVEDGRLWVLEAGIGERSAAAAARIAADLVQEGWITRDEASLRIGA
ncbi:MAG TPA: PEP/pyruvate-binding domain-containing protein [Nocardioides sp.]|nr:PEP/pyruvate-binding domain-containing protein [Nocardioides sp.]